MANDRAPSLWRTTPVRLTVIYTAVFVSSIAALLAIVYVGAQGYLEVQGDEIVRGQAHALSLAGPDDIARRIELALAQDRRSVAYYGLYDNDGAHLAGNVARLPAGMLVDGEPRGLTAGDFQPGARALAERLPDGRIVFVGYDAKTLTGLRGILLRSLLWSGALVTIGGIALGAVFGAGPVRRVRTVGAMVRRVERGDLSGRLPVSRRGDEIDALSGVVNTMMSEVERLLGDVKSVGDNLAHDLRTPLNHLRGHLHRSLERWDIDDEPVRHERLEAALAAADALRARFSALERIAQIEQHERQAGFAPFAPGALVREIGEIYAPVADDRGICLIVAAHDGAEMHGDRDLLAEALANLVDNALKFTQRGGTVTLCSMPGAQSGFEVRDDGPGIPASELSRVVERFGRGRLAQGVPGSGLGLAIVAAIARLHGSTLYFEDACPGLIVRLRVATPELTSPAGLP